MIEKILKVKLMDFLEKTGLFSDRQFSFRRGRGTTDAVMGLTGIVYSGLNHDKKMIAVLLYIRKAFDSIDPEFFRKKVLAGIRGKIYDLVASFLSSRKQFVKIGKSKSKMEQMDIGVLQGSELGPLRSLIFINDLCSMKGAGEIYTFADDAAVVFTEDNLTDLMRKGLRVD